MFLVWESRKKLFLSNQSVSYSNHEPLMIMKGDGAFLIDEKGQRYMDTRNNVGHVGWQHPAVVKAVQEQVSQCNVNTRYLHPLQVRLGEKLVHHFDKAIETAESDDKTKQASSK